MTGEQRPEGLRDRKKRATHRALTEAAVRLAAEHGAENVTVEAISEAAGVSPRTFFNYFDNRDEAFVMIDADVADRVRRAVLDAPPERPPLWAVADAYAAELPDPGTDHELWELRVQVLRRSPHLLVRTLGAHQADEERLAGTIAARVTAAGCADPGVYPRLLAAVANTAARVAMEHWSSGDRERPVPEIFREVFGHLAAGLPAPGPAAALTTTSGGGGGGARPPPPPPPPRPRRAATARPAPPPPPPPHHP
ncbi:TetR/AcrR family transcriptional regulator, partial [Streptomyces xiamenensis]